MLTPAEQRLTAAQVLAHPWVVAGVRVSAVPLPPHARKNLQRFGTLQKLKKAVLSYLATQLSEKEVMALKKSFVALDKNGDGILSCEEILLGLKGSPGEAELARVVGMLDTDKSGFVDYNGEICGRE
jgi:calcium-dependent protein kinase